MAKAVIFSALICLIIFACTKTDSNQKKATNQNFDVAFYRGPDMRPEQDYVVIDSGLKAIIPTPSGNGSINCTTSGLLHFTLTPGAHTVTYFIGNTVSVQTLNLASSGATLGGTSIPFQSCNSGLSILIEDI